MIDFNMGNLIKRNLEVLLRTVNNHQGIFSELSYNGLQGIFHEPAMKEISSDKSQVIAAFMARRLQQAMPLSASIGPAEESSLNAVIRDIGLWKERTGYLYHHDANSSKRETPDSTDAKFINNIVNGYFSELGLKDISPTKGSGYLTWRGSEFLDKISMRMTFDIRNKYDWRMRFNIGIFSKDGMLLCNVSDWEIFGKIIYAVVELNFDCSFEYCGTQKHNFINLYNYLSVAGSVLNEIRTWRF
ncbi:hypothetical protein [Mesorhizobium japonicum]|uniref:hypothetical protein n=1 Tax=Mesorhizobium japonicum TaxID=2066070 RepID=UPI0005CA25B5|nr:hypothetical protein [Mesorhizobium japonicum]